MSLKAIKKIIPKIIREKRWEFANYLLKRKIIAYLKSDRFVQGYSNSDRKDIYSFLKNNTLSVFPYEFTKKYKADNIQVYTDNECNLKYVLHENKRLYFKPEWTESQIKEYYNNLLIEQDIDSPHRYEFDNFYVNENDIVVDVGGAEGIFSLTVVERAKKIYLFEPDESWNISLQKTFEPWGKKITVVNKFVSDCNTENSVCLDDYFRGTDVTYLKVDAEGFEKQIISGAKIIISSSNLKKLKMVVCVYHRQNDAEEINELVKKHGFSTEFSKGYMIFKYDKYLTEPYLRRGLLRTC